MGFSNDPIAGASRGSNLGLTGLRSKAVLLIESRREGGTGVSTLETCQEAPGLREASACRRMGYSRTTGDSSFGSRSGTFRISKGAESVNTRGLEGAGRFSELKRDVGILRGTGVDSETPGPSRSPTPDSGAGLCQAADLRTFVLIEEREIFRFTGAKRASCAPLLGTRNTLIGIGCPEAANSRALAETLPFGSDSRETLLWRT